VPKVTKLNPRQMKFVEAYLRHGNANQACKEAGYGKNMAHAVMKSALVQAAIEKARKKSQERNAFTLDSAMMLARHAFQVGEQTGNAMAMTKAAELMAKLNGLLVEKIDLRAQTQFSIQIGGLALPTYAKDVSPKIEAPKEDDDSGTEESADSSV
jgi:phage terminase small subunit